MRVVESLAASDATGLERIGDRLRGAYFAWDGVVFDAAEGTVTVLLAHERSDQEPAPERTTWRYSEREVPLVRCVLSVTAAKETSPVGRPFEPALLSRIRHEPPWIVLETADREGLRIWVTQIDVRLYVTDEVERVVRRRRGRFTGIESEQLER